MAVDEAGDGGAGPEQLTTHSQNAETVIAAVFMFPYTFCIFWTTLHGSSKDGSTVISQLVWSC